MSLTSYLKDIADAIRNVEESSNSISVSDFNTRIRLLKSGPASLSIRDRLIIPDKYNCGCRGTLEKFDITTDTSGLIYRDNSTVVDCNNGKGFRYVLDKTITFENYDFTDYDSLSFMNGRGWTESSTYVPERIRIVFKNCLINQIYGNYAFNFNTDKLLFEFYNCTVKCINLGNANFYNCLIGGEKWWREMYPNKEYFTGDTVNPLGRNIFDSCYIYDVEFPTETQGTGHIDGLQTYQAIDDLHLYNCRFECYDMPFPISEGGWSYSIYWEKVNTNSSLEYCIANGGGIYGLAITKGDSIIIGNNKVSKTNNSYYPNVNYYQESDNVFSYTDKLYVSSVWKEDDKLYFVCSNDTQLEKTLTVEVGNNTYTFNLAKCPKREGEGYSSIQTWDDLPFDKLFYISYDGTSTVKMYDGDTLIRTWGTSNVAIVPTPSPLPSAAPVVPQTGTWQLKTTTDKKYVILGTDDDVPGNTKYFRMLRSYGFPYTMNVEPELLDRQLGSDVADYFTDDDAASVFPDGATVTDLGKYLISSGLGEVAQHGASSKTLWNSNLLTDDKWNTLYATYTAGGGTKTLSEFKTAVLNAGKSTDIAQDASYVSEGRATIQQAMGSYVYTLAIWGGEPSVTIDEIEINLKVARDYGYPYRTNNYTAAGTQLTTSKDNTSTYDIVRDSNNFGGLDALKANLSVGKVAELFVHNTAGLDITQLRADLTKLKGWVDAGEVQVITRKQYAEMGEYVSNPVKSISVTRESTTINVGDTDSASEYTVTATFNDNTTADVTSDSIIKYITDTSEAKVIAVPAYYKGFTATVNVEISGGTSIYIEPTILVDKKISHSSAVVTTGYGAKVYRYDITGLEKFYMNASKKQVYYIGYTAEPIEEGALEYWTTTQYYLVGSNEVTVPEGMNYFYVNSSSSAGWDVYPWSVTREQVQ